MMIGTLSGCLIPRQEQHFDLSGGGGRTSGKINQSSAESR